MAERLAHDPTFVDRFTREARAAAMLSHPNVVSVSDQGSDQGLVFLVMELVRGRTPRDLLQARGRLTVAEDRKSRRLNSSHANISYAVFCLINIDTHREP